MFGPVDTFWIAVTVIGLVGSFLFSDAWWRRQPSSDAFDLAETLGVGEYSTVIQLLSLGLFFGGIIGFVML